MEENKPPDGNKIKFAFRKAYLSIDVEGHGGAVTLIIVIIAAAAGYVLWIRRSLLAAGELASAIFFRSKYILLIQWRRK